MHEAMTTQPPRPLRLIAALQQGEMQARLLELFADAVTNRMLPTLCLTEGQTAEYVQADIELAHDADINSGIYSDWRIGERQTEATPFSALSYAQMEMAHIRHHLFGFAFVGLFHLFERQLATVLGWLDYRYGRAVWGETGRPVNVEFGHLMGALRRARVPMEHSLRRDIRRLQLIANSVKHSGVALTELSKHHRDLLVGWYPELPLLPEHLTLTPDVFQGFVASLAGFWRAFPQE
jgi:hypothetical protein